MNTKAVPGKTEFIKSATKPSEYPSVELPEIAFVGRSNVGKSSLINALLNRRNLAKVSKQPGRTRLINFFRVGHDLIFVDLPGYGYAKISQSEQQAWARMIETYLQSRLELKLSVLILDIRHDPSQDDLQMQRWFAHFNAPFLLVLTKADKIAKSKRKPRLERIAQQLHVPPSRLVAVSALTNYGIDTLWLQIQRTLQTGENV